MSFVRKVIFISCSVYVAESPWHSQDQVDTEVDTTILLPTHLCAHALLLCERLSIIYSWKLASCLSVSCVCLFYVPSLILCTPPPPSLFLFLFSPLFFSLPSSLPILTYEHSWGSKQGCKIFVSCSQSKTVSWHYTHCGHCIFTHLLSPSIFQLRSGWIPPTSPSGPFSSWASLLTSHTGSLFPPSSCHGQLWWESSHGYHRNQWDAPTLLIVEYASETSVILPPCLSLSQPLPLLAPVQYCSRDMWQLLAGTYLPDLSRH